jgi:putative hydrolase of HD superfamily
MVMENHSKLEEFLDFFILAERLKTELRHSWTNRNDRQESVAEHTWMMSLMALTLISEVNLQLDPLKVLKMVITHDLVEVITGDIPAHEISNRQRNKHKTEDEALDQLLSQSPNTTLRDEIKSLWLEFEAHESNEAKFVKAMDTLDAVLQHLIADLSTWDDRDFAWALSPVQDSHFDPDPFLRQLKDRVNVRTVTKVEAANAVSRMQQDDLEKWRQREGTNEPTHN